jgi:hypothetical protein
VREGGHAQASNAVRGDLLFSGGLRGRGCVAGGGDWAGATVMRDDGGTCVTTDNTSSWILSCKTQGAIRPDGAINQYITGSVITADSSPLPSRAVTDITTADTGVPSLVLDNVVITSIVAGIVTSGGRVKLIRRS